MNRFNFSNTTFWNTSNLVESYNITRAALFNPGWTPLLIEVTVVTCISFMLNLAALILQFLPQTQITSFAIYLIVICSSNVVYLAVVRPIGTLSSLTNTWTGGHSLCVIFLYFQKVVSVIPVLAHVLISINRLWAIKYPMSYRQHHHKKVAILLCLTMIGYVHLVPFPAFLVDFFYCNPPEKQRGCQPITGSMIHWSRTDFVLHRLIPLVFIVGVYIYIIVRRWQRRREVTDQDAGNRGSSQNCTSARTAVLAAAERARAGTWRTRPMTGVIRRRRVKPFIVLTMTSVSVLICWIPADVYWFAMVYLDVRLSSAVFSVATTLYSVQMIFDPLMWFFSLR
ncbi:adipokinetic hormone/corazonin-related peptide receptor variant I-like [Paramacrobiotus metropolitanus]|uniref:adipokinetic hormone/corazonin-related peptide receptor variant I-like n=1 Tax=Paramacrobiotus metropolitanus TaxID=2943436 RepID=UPI0024463183|nr:adipokinetic hormone/corazonin-related peptide receptor variant I-like [Paramacrobiotus metropolitanus]